ncbi:unnamed protein product [Cladocopium goreaui]|uniref:Ion transport domain-containing protein n=1 Tax=Cladocopium goreaui TaxID=2562237 RepID=A0A9P1CAQ8_9DINO|nr:unnamed protein product [Cladocopium goreaui]
MDAKLENSLLTGPSKESQVSPRGQRNNAWHDVLEICKKGFANKMSSMSDEILAEVRLEVDQSATALRKDVAEMLEHREKSSNEKLAELDGKMEAVVGWAQAGYVDFSKFDFTPLLDEIRSNETLHAESSRQMSQRFEESFLLLSNALDKLASKAEEEEAKIRGLTERVQKSEEKLSEVSHSVEASQKQLSEQLRELHDGNSQSALQLAAHLNSTMQPVEGNTAAIRDDLRQIFDRLGSNNNSVLNEIGKIQQAMNLDFVRTDDGDDSWPMGQSAAVVSTAFDLMRGRNTEKNAPKRVRVREFFSQTDAIEQQEKMVQTDPKMQGSEKKKEKPQPRGSKLKVQKTELKAKEGSAKLASSRTRGFNDPDQLKQKARQALIKPPYNVFDYYHEEGVFQRVAKSTVFDYLSLTVVCLNAMWIAVDADLNGAALITDAPPVFIVVENLFCTYFVSEVFIRFMAFEEKSRCLRDRWFVFDSLLVFFMVLETWIAPIIVVSFNIDLDNALDLSTLRMFRMVKLLRLSRMAKLLHAVPELTIIMKGIKYASRSVLVFFLFWSMVVYVFALILRQVTVGYGVGTQYFSNVPQAVNNLLLYGIIPSQRDLVDATSTVGAWMWPVIVFFFFFVSITIMYMLVGVLVDVMRVTSQTEKEGITISYLAHEFRDKMEQLSCNPDEPISQFEFQKLLLEPDIALILAGEGVDVIALVDSLDMVYEDVSKNGKDGLDFAAAMDLILNMRGNNPATVKDVKEQLRIMKSLVKTSQFVIVDKMNSEFAHMHSLLKELREEALQRETQGEFDED